jgi:hypothetical protein
MAKTTTPAQAEPSTSVALRNEAVPDYLREYQGPTGTENIDSKDVNIPRLKLGQSMNPEVKDKLVEEGDFFHNITKQVLIKKGATGIIIPICFSKQYLLWRDRNDGGGIMARANRVILPGGEVRHKWDKPNSEFTHKLGGKTKVTWKTGTFVEDDGLSEFGSEVPGDSESGPAATAHYNYVIMLPEHEHIMLAVSLSRSSAKKAKDLNALLKMGNAPMFARQIAIASIPDANAAGDTFFNYAFQPAGFVKDRVLFEGLAKMHMELKEKGINVDFSDEESTKPAGDKDEAERF